VSRCGAAGSALCRSVGAQKHGGRGLADTRELHQAPRLGALARAVHRQLALLLDRFDGHETHVGPGDGLAEGGSKAMGSSNSVPGTPGRTRAGLPVAPTP
jgi:hypothetical protein